MLLLKDPCNGLPYNYGILPEMEIDRIYVILLVSHSKWGKLQDELDDWLKDYDAERIGMLISFNDINLYTLMRLTWS